MIQITYKQYINPSSSTLARVQLQRRAASVTRTVTQSDWCTGINSKSSSNLGMTLMVVVNTCAPGCAAATTVRPVPQSTGTNGQPHKLLPGTVPQQAEAESGRGERCGQAPATTLCVSRRKFDRGECNHSLLRAFSLVK
jgi:hypothetical protein